MLLFNLSENFSQKMSVIIYKMNDGRQNGQPTNYVSKSSKTLGQIALHMDQGNDHFMSNEYCHFDFEHSRCSGLKTIGAFVYHPLL